MTREQMDEMHGLVIRKWARHIADMTDAVPRGLLDDLAVVANHQAITSAAESVERPARRTRKAAET